MANTYSKIYIHTVFAIKYRKGMIHPDWENRSWLMVSKIMFTAFFMANLQYLSLK